MADRSRLAGALTKLEVLVGTGRWSPNFDGTPRGTATIEWALDHRFLIWWAIIPDPRFPDNLSIVSVNSDNETYTQHYFDSFGSARIHKMTLKGELPSLLRDEPDFAPL